MELGGWESRKRRRRRALGESGVKLMEGTNEVEAPTFAKKSLPIRGTGQVGMTKNE